MIFYDNTIYFHSGLIYKLLKIGISGLHLELIQSYQSNRKQRVVLNNCLSVRGSLLFLVYINDLFKDIKSDNYLFVDDSSLFKIFNCSTTATDILNKKILIKAGLKMANSYKFH